MARTFASKQPTVTPTPERATGYAILGFPRDASTVDKWQTYAVNGRGAAQAGLASCHGGSWRLTAPASLQTFDPDDFGVLNASGRMRAEMLKWIAAVHASDILQVGKWMLAYGGSMAVGALPGANDGPRSPTTGNVTSSINWARKNRMNGEDGPDQSTGVNAFPLVDVLVDSGTVQTWCVTAPWGEYDMVLTDGRPCSRAQAWAEMDCRAVNRFFDEPCELAGSGRWATAHTRRDHFPVVQVKPALPDPTSLEYAQGLVNSGTSYPLIGAANQMTVATAVSALSGGATETITVSWSGSPLGGTTASNENWSPWLVNGTTVNGRGALIVYDQAGDPSNDYESWTLTSVTTNAGGTAGTMTIERGRYGPPTRAWSANVLKVAIAEWATTGYDPAEMWAGTPGVGGAESAQTLWSTNRDTYEVTSFTGVVPLRWMEQQVQMITAWKARARALAGETVIWQVSTRNASNEPQPTTYQWTGRESEREVETLVSRAFERHAIDCEFLVAEWLGPRHASTVYLGAIGEGPYFQRWTSSTNYTALTETYVLANLGGQAIPDGWFSAKTVERLSGGYQYPQAWGQAVTAWWAASDGIFCALARPGSWNVRYTGWERRFGFGVTHVEAKDLGSGSWTTPWGSNPQDFGGWTILTRKWLSPSKLMFQFRGSGILTNGPEVPRTCEDVISHVDGSAVPLNRPLTIEGNYTRLTATADISAAYGGWLGSVLTEQAAYLTGTRTSDGADVATAANSLRARMNAAYLATT